MNETLTDQELQTLTDLLVRFINSEATDFHAWADVVTAKQLVENTLANRRIMR